jgi:hypothetical protein
MLSFVRIYIMHAYQWIFLNDLVFPLITALANVILYGLLDNL